LRLRCLRKALTIVKLLEHLVAQEHVETWHMRRSKCPLTAKARLVLLVVNSVKLHLTALYFITITKQKFAQP